MRDLFAALPEDFYDEFCAKKVSLGVKLLDEPFGKSVDIPLPEPLERTYDKRSFSKLVDLVHTKPEANGHSNANSGGFSMKYSDGKNDWSGSSGETEKPEKVPTFQVVVKGTPGYKNQLIYNFILNVSD